MLKINKKKREKRNINFVKMRKRNMMSKNASKIGRIKIKKEKIINI